MNTADVSLKVHLNMDLLSFLLHSCCFCSLFTVEDSSVGD